MKKFWSIFTVALVALSAVSCSNNFEEEVVLGGETLSFNVNIDNTRTALKQDENSWNTVWVGNETLVVSYGQVSYNFSNTVENKNKFTCTADGVLSLVGKSVKVVYNPVINSAAGAAGMTLAGAAKEFGADSAVELSAGNAFLKLTSTADVTLTASADIFGDGSARLKSVTVKAGTDVLVPIYAAKEVTLSAIKDVTVKEKVLTFENNKIYNLGTLTEAPTIYLVPNADWKQADAWYSAHFYNSNGGFADVKMTDAEADGIYECKVPANMTDVIFCRMNPAYPEFSWNSEEENNHVWNETISSTIGVEPNNYYYITDWTVGEWHEVGYKFPVASSPWSISGDINGWGDTVMDATATNNLFVAKNVSITTAYSKFKIRKDKDWAVNYGGAYANFEANKFMKVYKGGQDMFIVQTGVYDIYFQYVSDNEGKVYIVTAGNDYKTAVEQTKEGPAPSPTNVSFGLVGAHNSWGSSKDTVLAMDTSLNAYVAKSAKLSGEFKVRGDNTWGAYNYGAKSNGTVTVGKAIDVQNSSNTNLKVASGTYDVYFSYGKNKVWVMKVGEVPTDL